MLRFAQSMTRLASKLLGTRAPFDLLSDEEADTMLELSVLDFPTGGQSGRSLFTRKLGIISQFASRPPPLQSLLRHQLPPDGSRLCEGVFVWGRGVGLGAFVMDYI